MSRRVDAETIRTIADAGADAVARWRASKRALRMNHYRRRMEQVKEPDPKPWLMAVEIDDERELVLEEQVA
jgi:hypothetical protein